MAIVTWWGKRDDGRHARIQSIITLIDSDLPSRENEDRVFDETEVIVVLHDEGDQGRLFKMGHGKALQREGIE